MANGNGFKTAGGLLLATFLLAACGDDQPSVTEIEQSVNKLAAATPLMGGSGYKVQDTFCSTSANGSYACIATASDGKAKFKTQIKMSKENGKWSAEFLGPPQPVS